MSRESLKEIAIDLIDEDVDNHRLVHDPVADAELKNSVVANGVQQPIKVCTKDGGRYTLVFGFRRKKAALAAGRATIPAIVVDGLSPADIRKFQAIENLERKDLHPLEEAQFCQDLVEQFDPLRSHEKTAEAYVGARVGRSVKWVENRLALARLSPRVRQGFLDDDITLAHAKLIAQLVSHEAQEEVFGQVKARTGSYYLGHRLDDEDEEEAEEPLSATEQREREESRRAPSTIAETRNLVNARLRRLNEANWLLDQPFDGKPACSECPHNSVNQPGLFDGDRPAEPTCLNAPCHEEKRKFAMRAIQRATNTAVSTGAKPTPKGVEAAIVAREVTFVKPEAVAEKVKFAKAPASSKKSTKAEQRGEAAWERKNKIDTELRKREQKWLTPIITAIVKKVNGDQWLLKMAILLDAAPASKDRASLVALMAKPSAQSFADLAAKIKVSRRFTLYDGPLDISQWHDKPAERQALCEALGIKVEGAKPDRRDIERELYPPKEKGAGDTAEAKKPKKKTAAKAKKKAPKKKRRTAA